MLRRDVDGSAMYVDQEVRQRGRANEAEKLPGVSMRNDFHATVHDSSVGGRKYLRTG